MYLSFIGNVFFSLRNDFDLLKSNNYKEKFGNFWSGLYLDNKRQFLFKFNLIVRKFYVSFFIAILSNSFPMSTVIFILLSNIFLLVYVIHYQPVVSRSIKIKIIFSEGLLIIIDILLLVICSNIE